ncbi:hypothetical protein FGE12_11550 [Aggregicoccus sp. 17bor-14]|uniref:hypothetical protein n=1 Tax=Myxococcaceae TaxID=31 RepID=UPI00129C479B|nr:MULTISPECIES: hypothetical protein [Myxococcaceae]MBF5043021.1 hypothetical protein [Simulacricoccus sp. 17bor-14]MRI88785.1 hypothetical protein [Aggregicoccus sp. 17bor-14]
MDLQHVKEPRFALRALGPGLVGALTVTGVHEGLRRVVKDPPRMDVLGMRALKKGAHLLGRRPAHGRRLHRQALAGDLAANSLFYALVALGKPRRPYLRGLTLGVLAGVGAVVLPPYLGLGRRPARAQPRTALLTVAYYTLAGLAAARATRRLTARAAAAL